MQNKINKANIPGTVGIFNECKVIYWRKFLHLVVDKIVYPTFLILCFSDKIPRVAKIDLMRKQKSVKSTDVCLNSELPHKSLSFSIRCR